MDNKTETFYDDKPEDFKCDCAYPCDGYPECGGVRVTFPSSAGVEETQEEPVWDELREALDIIQERIDNPNAHWGATSSLKEAWNIISDFITKNENRKNK